LLYLISLTSRGLELPLVQDKIGLKEVRPRLALEKSWLRMYRMYRVLPRPRGQRWVVPIKVD
ncbi:hypothetical protein L9F63_023164, partial [Diploptera punctata]